MALFPAVSLVQAAQPAVQSNSSMGCCLARRMAIKSTLHPCFVVHAADEHAYPAQDGDAILCLLLLYRDCAVLEVHLVHSHPCTTGWLLERFRC